MKRYAALLGMALAAALVLGIVARLPSRAARPLGIVARLPSRAARPQAIATPRAEVALTLVIADDRISPAASAVPKDHRVRLEMSNQGTRATTIALAGYEERLPSHT